jgi:hypothetical protein
MNGPPWLTGLKQDGLKRLIIVSVLLVCLYLLATGGYAMIQRFLFILGDETAGCSSMDNLKALHRTKSGSMTD